MNKQGDFTQEAKDFAKKRGGMKSLADAVGLPDAEDKARIQRYLLRYEQKHPGEIKFHRDMAKAYFQAEGGDKQKYGVVNKQAQGRVLFELPEQLGQWMEQAYPLMFREKTHTAWFAKNFPELLIPEKY